MTNSLVVSFCFERKRCPRERSCNWLNISELKSCSINIHGKSKEIVLSCPKRVGKVLHQAPKSRTGNFSASLKSNSLNVVRRDNSLRPSSWLTMLMKSVKNSTLKSNKFKESIWSFVSFLSSCKDSETILSSSISFTTKC